MDKDTFQLVSLLTFTLSIFVGSSFYLGRVYERRYWYDAIPKQMTQLCIECSGLSK